MEKDSRTTYRNELIGGIADTGRDSYEAPAIEELGSMAELTRSDLSFEVI